MTPMATVSNFPQGLSLNNNYDYDVLFAPYEIIDTTRRSTLLTWTYDFIRQLINREYTTNLKCKLFIVFKCMRHGHEKLIITLMRMDNLTIGESSNSTFYYKPVDKVWRTIVGWPVPLELNVPSLRQHVIKIPANLHSEIIQVEIDNPGIMPIPVLTSEIPKKIFQSWASDQISNAPKVIQKAITTFKLLNPGYQHFYFGTMAARQYIAERESERVLHAYDLLQPLAYKSDLWRCVVLYHEGGVYVDSKAIALVPLDYFLPSNGGIIVNDIRGAGILNAFMAMPPHDILMRNAIDQITTNVENRYYGNSTLDITGPRMLADCLAKLPKAVQSKYDRLQFENTGILIKHRNLAVISQHNGEYRRLVSRPGMKNHYENFWLDRTIYGENNIEGEISRESTDKDYAKRIFVTIIIAVLLFLLLFFMVYKRKWNGHKG